MNAYLLNKVHISHYERKVGNNKVISKSAINCINRNRFKHMASMLSKRMPKKMKASVL